MIYWVPLTLSNHQSGQCSGLWLLQGMTLTSGMIIHDHRSRSIKYHWVLQTSNVASVLMCGIYRLWNLFASSMSHMANTLICGYFQKWHFDMFNYWFTLYHKILIYFYVIWPYTFQAHISQCDKVSQRAGH